MPLVPVKANQFPLSSWAGGFILGETTLVRRLPPEPVHETAFAL